ncbi:hypothetical protein BF95_14685 [Sphingobium sp. Ant17]|nr:hypothetical protein BF95_14685 [Sphingobium sp. Ant17]
MKQEEGEDTANRCGRQWPASQQPRRGEKQRNSRPMLKRRKVGIGLRNIGQANRHGHSNDHPALRDWNGVPGSSSAGNHQVISPS